MYEMFSMKEIFNVINFLSNLATIFGLLFAYIFYKKERKNNYILNLYSSVSDKLDEIMDLTVDWQIEIDKGKRANKVVDFVQIIKHLYEIRSILYNRVKILRDDKMRDNLMEEYDKFIKNYIDHLNQNKLLVNNEQLVEELNNMIVKYCHRAAG